MKRQLTLLVALIALCASGCGKKQEDNKGEQPATNTGDKPGDKTDKPVAKAIGVDMDKKVVSIGTLNDESGPALAVGKPFANGKRLLVKRINAGGSGLLPDGWKVELIEKDHGYDPQRSVQQYNAVKNSVLFIGTSFGTRNTLPLRKSLERDDIIAFPASLSSKMAEHPNTPPLGASYVVEARRALDWAVEQAGGADKVKAGIVYQKDDYGKDGFDGWKAQAKARGVKIVAEQTVAPGQKDVTAVITSLKNAGANYVLLVTLPTASGPILGTAAQLEYKPTWIGSTPSWSDRFFSKDLMPPAVLANFYWVTSLAFWGEDLPGMKEFLAAWDAHGKDMGAQDSYILMSYIAGLIQIEVLRRTIESGDVSRSGFRKAMKTVKGWDAGGFIQPIDLSQVPYQTQKSARILKPVPDKRTWELASDYAEPKI